MLQRAKHWARSLTRDVAALWIAARDPRVPWHLKAAAAAVAAYALSPIDLIPDFVPVLGYLDDLVMVPIGILIVVRSMPRDLMGEFRAEAERREWPSASYAGLAAILLVWSATLAAALVWWRPPFAG